MTTTTTADQLQSLTSAADKVDAGYAKMEFVCSRCQKRERQTQTTLPLHSIDRPSLRRTAVDIAGGGGGGGGRFPAAAVAGRAAGLFPSSAILKAKSERISSVDDQRLSPEFHQKQISNLITKPDSAGSDGILVASTTIQDTGRDPRTQDVAESREAPLENSNKELQNIRKKETVTEFAKEFPVSLGTGPADEMSSIPLLTQDSASPSDNLGQSKTSEIILAVERNTKALESKWSNSSSSITSRLPNGEKQNGKSKLPDDVAKRLNKGNTATVTVSSNGSVTTYSGSNLSLWMQFGGGNEPEKIVAKQAKSYRLKKHQKQTAADHKFAVEAATALRSSENPAGQPKPRNKKELVVRRLKNRDFVDTDDTESHDQSTLFDMDVVKVYKHNDNQPPTKERLTHNRESNKSSPSNSHQSSIFSKSTSIQSEVENQPARSASRNQPFMHNGTPSKENQAKMAAFKSSAAAMEKTDDDDMQLVIDSVKEYCSFQIPVSLTASPDLDNNSLSPDNGVPPTDVVDPAKRVENLPQTDRPTKPIAPPAADTRNAKAAGYSEHCKAYRTYFETLAEKTQTRESMQSTSRFNYCDKKRQGKTTTPAEQSSCKTSRPDPAAEFSGLEKTIDKDPVSLAKLHFVSDESMITYLSGIRTNLHGKFKNLKTFSNQTMDHVSPRGAGPLSNEEIIKERQQSTSCGAKTQTISDQNQPTKIGTASVLAGAADICGIETVCRVGSPTDDDVFQAASKAPLGLDDQRLLATASGQTIRNDIRHHYVNMRPTSVDANLDRNPTTVHRPLSRRVLNLPDVDKAGGGPVSSAMSAADKEPMNDNDVGADGASSQEASSSGPSTGRVAQLKIMAAAVEAPSVWVTKSPHDLIHASSASADHVLSSDSCDTARQCECRRSKDRGASPSADCTASDTRNEEEDQDETAEGKATAKHRHIRSADDTSIPTFPVPQSNLLAVVVAPGENRGAGVGASTGGQDLLLDREQKPD